MKSLTFALISLLIVSIGCQDSANKTTPQTKISVSAGEIGSLLPSFATVDLNGHQLASTSLKNKVALIDFWATWCAPCRKEMPGYQMLQDRYSSRGFVVIGFKVDVMADTEDPLRFIHELGIHYPIAIGSEDIRAKFGGLQGLPTTYIYDRQGILRNKIIGFEYTDTIEKTIKELL
jgi:thiol-disulfide isomerase/thioredoxin